MIPGSDKAREQIQSASRILVMHDGDADGICSAALTIHALGQLYPDTKIYRHGSALKGEHLFPDPKPDVDLFLFLDCDPANYEQLDNIDKPYVVIDHHELRHESKGIIINPHVFGSELGSKYCTTKLVYDFWSQFTDVS